MSIDAATDLATVRPHTFEGFAYESRTVPGFPPGTAPGARPVLLVGGAFQRKEAWGRLEDQLRRERPVITVDLPGWGTADTLPAEYGFDFLVRALAHALPEILGELGADGVDLAGGSYGAPIIYGLAQSHPQWVHHLVIMACMTEIPQAVRADVEDTLILLDEGRMDEFAAATVALFMCADRAKRVVRRTAIERILLRRFASVTPDEVEKYTLNTRRLLAGEQMDLRRGLRTPLLVVTGEHDTYTPPEISRRVAASARDGAFAVIAEADHMNHLERPEESAELFLTFFADRPVEALPYCRDVERMAAATAR